MAQEVKFYMQKEGESAIDLEAHFLGLRYQKCVGLNDKGKRKNIYIEEYSDSDTLRVWQGEEATRKATTITFTFFFIGDTRHEAFNDFYEYVKNGQIRYWDTARNKEALLVLADEVKIGDDSWKGSIPYFEVPFKFQNLWGECKDKE
jgi:hypothetical protein